MARQRDSKYLRLTGMWPSKSNKSLFTGRVKPEDVSKLLEKAEEAVSGDVALVFGLWENDKKENRKDPDFSLQCFVGEADEKPRSSRRSRDEDDEDEAPRKKRKPVEEEAEDEEEEAAPRKKKKAAEADEDEDREVGKSKRKPALDEEEEEEEEAPKKKKAAKEDW